MGTSLAVPTFGLRVPSPGRGQSAGTQGTSTQWCPLGVPGPPGPVVPAGRALEQDLAAAEAEPWPDASGDRRLYSAPAAPLLKETEPPGSGRDGTCGDPAPWWGSQGSCPHPAVLPCAVGVAPIPVTVPGALWGPGSVQGPTSMVGEWGMRGRLRIPTLSWRAWDLWV